MWLGLISRSVGQCTIQTKADRVAVIFCHWVAIHRMNSLWR